MLRTFFYIGTDHPELLGRIVVVTAVLRNGTSYPPPADGAMLPTDRVGVVPVGASSGSRRHWVWAHSLQPTGASAERRPDATSLDGFGPSW